MQVLDTEQTRSMQGYIGLQNHDKRAVVKFKNIRREEIELRKSFGLSARFGL
jgi:hypothetical protein